jgi:serine/threonine protein kinase
MLRTAKKKRSANVVGKKKHSSSTSAASMKTKTVELLSTENGLSDDERDNEGLEGYRIGGYHPVSIGDTFNQKRYTVLKKLGWGHFSTVWLVKNHQAKPDTGRELLALKIQKSSSRYTDAAKDEIAILNELMRNSNLCPTRSQRVVFLYDNFVHLGPHGNHVCFTFEPLGENLLVFIKRYGYRGLPRQIVREIAYQVCQGLDYMHRVCHIIHTDLKPENVVCAVPSPKVMNYFINDANTSGPASNVNLEPVEPVNVKDLSSLVKHIRICELVLDGTDWASKSKKKRVKTRMKKLREELSKYSTEEIKEAWDELEKKSGINKAPVNVKNEEQAKSLVHTSEKCDDDDDANNDATAESKSDTATQTKSQNSEAAANNESNKNTQLLHQREAMMQCLGISPSETPPSIIYVIAEIESWQRAYLLSDAAERILVFSTRALARKFLMRYAEDPDLECCLIIGLNSSVQARLFDPRTWENLGIVTGSRAQATNATREGKITVADLSNVTADLHHRFLYFSPHLFHQQREQLQQGRSQHWTWTSFRDPCILKCIENMGVFLDCNFHNDASSTQPAPAQAKVASAKASKVGIKILSGLEGCNDHDVSWKYPPAHSYVNVLFAASLSVTVAALKACAMAEGGHQYPADDASTFDTAGASSTDGAAIREPDSDSIKETAHGGSASPGEWRKSKASSIEPSAARLAESHLRILEEGPPDITMHCYNIDGEDDNTSNDTRAESKQSSAGTAARDSKRQIDPKHLALLRPHISTLSRASACVIQGIVAAADRYAHAIRTTHLDDGHGHDGTNKKTFNTTGIHESNLNRDNVDAVIENYVPQDICLWSLRMHKDNAITVLGAMEACIPGLRFMQFRGSRNGLSPSKNTYGHYGSDSLLPKAILTRRSLPIDLPQHFYMIGSIVPTVMPSGKSNRFVAGAGISASNCLPIAQRLGICLDAELHRTDNDGFTSFDDGRRVLAKIVDFGNACWEHEHFTEDIQTRQYRSPEVIIGAGYDTTADVWSFACLVFELLTGDMLFDPRTRPSSSYTRDQDHISLMVEMMGDFDRTFAVTGRRSKEFFTKKGLLKQARALAPCPLKKLFYQKYAIPEHEATVIADFMASCLALTPSQRWSAERLLGHPWFKNIVNGQAVNTNMN